MNININIDYQSRIPIYDQIESEIIKYVSLGILKPNDKLPSIRELAVELGVNPNTIKRVYDDLETKKVIVAISTKGNFISNNVDEIIKIHIDSIINNIKKNIADLKLLNCNDNQIKKMIFDEK